MKYALLALLLGLAHGAASAQETVESCTVCHRDALTLEGWEAPGLAARLKEMRDAGSNHVPPIPELSDEEIEQLAAVLAGS